MRRFQYHFVTNNTNVYYKPKKHKKDPFNMGLFLSNIFIKFKKNHCKRE